MRVLSRLTLTDLFYLPPLFGPHREYHARTKRLLAIHLPMTTLMSSKMTAKVTVMKMTTSGLLLIVCVYGDMMH